MTWAQFPVDYIERVHTAQLLSCMDGYLIDRTLPHPERHTRGSREANTCAGRAA